MNSLEDGSLGYTLTTSLGYRAAHASYDAAEEEAIDVLGRAEFAGMRDVGTFYAIVTGPGLGVEGVVLT